MNQIVVLFWLRIVIWTASSFFKLCPSQNVFVSAQQMHFAFNKYNNILLPIYGTAESGRLVNLCEFATTPRLVFKSRRAFAYMSNVFLSNRNLVNLFLISCDAKV